ncbi:hypothetical protein BJ166DRAFT_590014 [Pestalotiopsis sp. NC0098]|nr:hypothetical protein BJ166DRAFT_590014 [Pestalotiopsis sp. NC0098]
MDIFYATKEFIHSNVGSIPAPISACLWEAYYWLDWLVIFLLCRELFDSDRRESERDPGLDQAVKHLHRLLPRAAYPFLFAMAISCSLSRYPSPAGVVAAWLSYIFYMLWVGFMLWYYWTYRAIVVRYRAQKEWNKGEPWALHHEKFEDLEPGNTWAPVGEVQGRESEEGTDISSPNVLDAQSLNAAHITQ